MAQPPKASAETEAPPPGTDQPGQAGAPDHGAAGPEAAKTQRRSFGAGQPPGREPGTAEAGAVIGRPRGPAAGDGLSDLERRILAFEKRPWSPQDRGPKERAIREEFDLSPTRYGQILHALLDNPAAIAREPVLVNRLRRLRDQRAAARTGRTG